MMPPLSPLTSMPMLSPTFRSLLLLLSSLLLITTVRAAPPAVPTGFTLTWSTAGLISCSWTDRSNDEAGFIVAYRTNSASQFSRYDSVAANTTTYSNTPTNWPGCTNFEWAVFAYKGAGVSEEVSTNSNIVTVTAPPRVTSAAYVSANVGQTFSHTLATACPSPVWTAAPMPPGLTFNAGSGVISGTPASHGRHTVNVTLTSGGKTVNHTLKIYVFRPVPALVAPENQAPLADRTLRRSAVPEPVDLNAHFNDPDVTDASRLVFNTGTVDFLYYPSAAPATVTNFKGYLVRGDLLNTIIHRSVPGFVLQGGGYLAEAGTPGITRQPGVVNEPEITNARGTVAMAKSEGNPDSATSEFFISLADNSSNLNNQNEGFSVFARVPAAGMAVADAIAALPIRNYGGAATNCPVTNPPPPAFSADSLVKLLAAGPVAPLSFTAESSAPAVCGVSVNSAQLALAPLAAGTAAITVTATDLDGQSLLRTFSVTVEEHLSDWLTAQNFPAPGDAAALANPDADTLPNIFEFALMTDPRAHSPEITSGTTTVGPDRFLTLSFPVRKLTGGSFRYAVESHSALTGAWTEVWNSGQGFAHAQVVASNDQPDRTDVTVRDTSAITAGGEHFLRLRVTDTP